MSNNTTVSSHSAAEAIFQPLTLIDLLRWQALGQPERVAYTFLTDGETEEVRLTYGELDRQARAIAAWLQPLVANGEHVLLLYPPGLEYIAAFFGCLYAGAVAVPAYPPRRSRNMLRLQAIVADAEATVALTTAPILSRIVPFFSQNPHLQPLRWLTTENVAGGVEDNWQEPAVTGESLAFLQYTSGSTSAPKGVMLSHNNLLHNEQMVQMAFRQTEESIVVGWLPLYHDMGLIGNVIQPLFTGARCILMSPLAFLQKPLRWLRAISEHRATTSGGPNFAYDLCARKISMEERAQLDLSSWTVAFNGAEPIRYETMERFVAAFEPCGFRREAFSPCYGLAEATLLVSAHTGTRLPVIKRVQAKALENNLVLDADPDHENARLMIGCGGAMLDQQIVIVHPETLMSCSPEQVGEIWVAGSSIAAGYWNRAEQTELTFRGYLSDTGEGPFLRTGDLGFLQNGELFVTGRLKDLIIIRGRNHYPQDIELTVQESHPSLRAGCGAAFSIEVAGGERLVIVQEVDHRRETDLQAVIETIIEAVAEEHEVQTHAVILIKPGSLPKTSSGKIQHHACRTGFLESSLGVVADWREAVPAEADAPAAASILSSHSRESIAAWLQSQLAAKLGREPGEIDVNQSIARYGLDSLTAIELMHGIEASLGVSVPITSFLQSPNIVELAAQVSVQLAANSAPKLTLTASDESLAEHPLSQGQQALWFLHQLAPSSAAYNLAGVVRIISELDAPALQRTFQALVNRHPSLRTTFNALDGTPVQRIHEHMEVSFEEEDAATWSEAQLNERLSEEAHRPFDLENGPVLRVLLFKRSAQEHVLLLVVHHIVADFWSLAVLMHELGALYRGERDASVVTLAPLPLHYTDYVRWQEEMLASAEGERLWSYWQKQLAGELPVLNLPTDRPRPSVQTYQGASRSFKLNAELTLGLKALAQSNGATLYMTLLAAFQTLLYRYTEQTDIVVGSPTSGRNWNALAGLVGYFVNPVVIRSQITDNPTFATFLGHVRQMVLSAFEHQSYPFALLVERLQPERDPSRSPLFQVMFVLQQTHLLKEEGLAAFALGESDARIELPDLTLESAGLEQRVSQFDLTLMMAEADGELAASLEYNTDLFDAATIARLISHFETLLAAIVATPTERLSLLPLLTSTEEEQLLRQWNDTEAHYPQQLVHQLFEEQAERTPEAIAVVSGAEQLSYAELNGRANQLARHLRGLGVGPEQLVGILMERSIEMVVGLLGILKAGGAYVPADPNYPAERLSFMFEDAAVSVVLTQSQLVKRLPENIPTVVCLDTDWKLIEQAPVEQTPTSNVTPNNLAYVIYTSGSTGWPKGVAIEHHSTSTLLHWAADRFSERELATVLASTSLCFDLSVFELFVPLSRGGKVLVAENALQLPNLPAAQEVTLVNTVPSAMAELVRVAGLPASVMTVNLAGEALKQQLVEEIYEQTQVERVFNLYGPSEDTTYSTCALIERGSGLSPSIGRPIAQTQVYLLDGNLQPVPIGAVGELYIGGEGLARGYLRRPELTAERFVPNRFSTEGGARLYRTGDLARYRADGELEFLGRADHQVKVRGFRIELGEIEAVLGNHAGVRDVVVLARQDAPGQMRLVAYVIARDEHRILTASELRAYLKDKLPEHMVPSVFMLLDELPLTPNGKVDRGRLPAPEGLRPELENALVAARTPTEEVLVGIWSAVLGVEQVGISDNFFELGGHSLLATRVISRIQEAFELALPLRSLFETPTVSGLAQSIERARLEGESVSVPPITRVSREKELPLSFAQQRLWFLDQLEAGITAYHVPAAVRLAGRLHVPALRQSLSEIVRRHEALRTSFAMAQGQPVQVIAPSVQVSIPVVDVQGMASAEQASEVLRLINEEAQRPFDLARGPLLRLRLLRLAEEEHVMLLTIHHIVSDGWSLGVLFREMATLYEAFADGRPSPLPELAVQYADFTMWQREWARGEVLEGQLSYWKQQLGGKLPELDLPVTRQRLRAQSFRGASQPVDFSKKLSEDLKALSRRAEATLFMTLLAGFQVLLSRYSGQEDVIVGTPIAARNQLELEGLIGCFVNTLVLRTDLSNCATSLDLLKQVREVALGAYSHQDVPFEKLVEELQPERSLSHSPLFQVMFVLQNAGEQAIELPGLSISQIDVGSTSAKFDLTLSLRETAQGLSGSLEYNTDLFDAATIARLISHFETLLAAIVADPAQPVATLPLMSAAEQQQVIGQWNQTQRDYPAESCIHQLFEAQAARTPAGVALVFNEQQLTYGELNGRSNQLAHHLRSLGIGPEVPVGICMERSIEMVVALLATLKAGGAYVPLDPAYPQERLSFILEETRAPVLLTQQHLIERLPQQEAEVLCLDSDWDSTIAQQSSDNPPLTVSAENLAYMIYTSGSTGRPKGVAIEHRSAVTFLHWSKENFAPEIIAGMLASTSISFDLSVFELFAPLSWGGTVILALNALELPRLPKAQDVTLINTVPSAMAELVRSGGVPPSVRVVNLAGEPLRQSLVEEIYALGHVRQVFNLYGPSEDTTYSTWTEVERGASREPSIGRPVANTQAYVLDAHQQPVAVGVTGELYIGGEGLARGYLRRPELTAERFVPNRFSTEGGARLYRTGDLARYRADGELEFLGRADHQVKVRGFRIELGEIETVLEQHPAVQEAVVLAREDVAGDQRIVAYVVAEQPELATSVELRRHLREKVPEYMVPGSFMVLEKLPLTPNGKVDRRALPAPDYLRPESEGAQVAPRTPIEEVLTGIWAEVLGIEQVGIHDDFFELGGHSLLATQIISRVRETVAVDVALRSLFETPTVAGLAEHLETARQSANGFKAPPLVPVASRESLPLSFAQQRLWFLDQIAPGSPAYKIQAAVRLTGQLDVAALERTLNEIVRRHAILRTTFTIANQQPAQRITHEHLLALPVEDLRDLPATAHESVIRQLASEETRRPFDLARGPLLRLRLLRLAEEEHVMLLTIHHIVSDGWSLGVLVREVGALYEAFAQGESSPLPELPVQYADFACWQREWLRGEVLDAQLAYWKRQLGGELPVLALPTDRPRPEEQSFRGAQQYFTFSAELSESLSALSRREGVTLYMTLLAAFQTLLYRSTGQDDIVVGTDIANRNQFETEGLIGFFTNQLVLRTDLSGNPTFGELLKRVREMSLDAYAHQDLPFEKLVEELQPERSLSRNPLFQVMFILQNAPMPRFKLSGLTMSLLEIEEETSAFDLSLSLGVTGGGELGGWLRYSTDLFDASTIRRLLRQFETVLHSIAAGPETRLDALEIITEGERMQQSVEKKERRSSRLQKLMTVKPRTVTLSEENLLKADYLKPGQLLPLVMQPEVEGLDLLAWAEHHRDFIERQLLKSGAILFRNCNADSIEKFERFTRIISPDLMSYGERSSPRTSVRGGVYTSTEHPADQHILLHNEQSYTLNWPMKIWFFCVQPALEGGRTPIADSRKIFRRLPPAIVEQFAQKGVLYVRNYGDGLGLPWQEVFQTEDRRTVEEHCRKAAIEFEWKDDNRLRTFQVRPAVRSHPKTGEMVWFNHALFFNLAGLEAATRESLLAGVDLADIPFNTFYGDGTPIEPSVLTEIGQAYQQEQVSYSWQKGDILMLDNMLVAHGREPFVGPRQIVVAMAEPFTDGRELRSTD